MAPDAMGSAVAVVAVEAGTKPHVALHAAPLLAAKDLLSAVATISMPRWEAASGASKPLREARSFSASAVRIAGIALG